MTESGIDPRDLCKLATVQSEMEAQILEALLSERGIPSSLRSWRSHALDGIFQGQKGYAEVRVHRDDLERAEAVLADFKQQMAGEGAPEEPGPSESP